ncbi:c-type cytochrome, partial [Pseudomonas aeruginosa]|nr:c-type cytochrome [Pseudomonas aeruginosa]
MTERKCWLAGCLSALLSLPLAAAVPGPDAPADLARGKAMAQKMCSRCHDDDGNGGPRPNRSYPKLAGLDREYPVSYTHLTLPTKL